VEVVRDHINSLFCMQKKYSLKTTESIIVKGGTTPFFLCTGMSYNVLQCLKDAYNVLRCLAMSYIIIAKETVQLKNTKSSII
jgi:hypothetical protein